MVHLRLNEKETNPNPHINFMTVLPTAEPDAEEEARQLLRALAAQVRPIMKAHGFMVNSLEEYEHNRVFAGRNWNNGEVVELVLRGTNGSFLPVSWLMSTLCHELAHIQHMNHGPAFQALWTKLRNEVRELQSKGYYGDGYWSSGTRLADSARFGGQALDTSELPEYMCGGAHSRARPTSLRRRRVRQQPGPSNHTGAQTAKKRKAGSRVTARGTFKGSGRALNEDVSDDEQKKAGAGFRKKAGSKRAKEERALAAERRLQALQNQGASTASAPQTTQDASDDSSGEEVVRETDQDRRRAMLDSMGDADLESLRATRADYSEDFVLPGPASSFRVPTATGDDLSCDTHVPPSASATATSSHPSFPADKGKRQQSQVLEDWLAPAETYSGSRKKTKGDISYGTLVRDEMNLRKRESLGMTEGGRRLGGSHPSPNRLAPHARHGPPSTDERKEVDNGALLRDGEGPGEAWSCLVCTLSNDVQHLACAACSTPRGENQWVGNHM